jgi:hypothetical protein
VPTHGYIYYLPVIEILILNLTKSRKMRRPEHMACMEEVCPADRVLMEKVQLKRQLEKPWFRWLDNIKMDSQEILWGCGLG